MSDERPLGMEVPVPWLVWSHEHTAFWKPGRWGYTKFIDQAGRYTRAEAEAICKGAGMGELYDCGRLPNEICFPAPEAVEQLEEQIASLRAQAGEFAEQMLGDRE